MQRLLIAAAALAAYAAPAYAARPMTAGEVLTMADSVMKKSKVALMVSSDARTLVRTLKDSAERHRARNEADRAAGRKVTTCLPPKGKGEIKSNELLAYLRSLSPAGKGQSFDAALAGYLARKYPCR